MIRLSEGRRGVATDNKSQRTCSRIPVLLLTTKKATIKCKKKRVYIRWLRRILKFNFAIFGRTSIFFLYLDRVCGWQCIESRMVPKLSVQLLSLLFYYFSSIFQTMSLKFHFSAQPFKIYFPYIYLTRIQQKHSLAKTSSDV